MQTKLTTIYIRLTYISKETKTFMRVREAQSTNDKKKHIFAHKSIFFGYLYGEMRYITLTVIKTARNK